MRKRIPIIRLGWRDARELIKQGYELWGTELVSPVKTVKRWMGIYGMIEEREGGNADYYLTQRSIDLLKQSNK